MACVIGLASMAYVRHVRIARAEAEIVMLDDCHANMQRQLEIRGVLEKQQAELMIKKRINDELGSRVGALDVLAELGRLLSPDMVLRALEMETMEVRIPIRPVQQTARLGGGSARMKGKRGREVSRRLRLTITGVTLSDVEIANFIGQLSACPLFEDVSMGYAKNVAFRGRGAREFQASCYVIR